MPLSTAELNRLANYIVASDLTAWVHSDDPGNTHADNRIGTATATAAATSWSEASSGDVTYNADLVFGVLDTDNSQTPTWWSLQRGSAAVARGEINDPDDATADVTVPAGNVFQINTGTLVLNGSST